MEPFIRDHDGDDSIKYAVAARLDPAKMPELFSLRRRWAGFTGTDTAISILVDRSN
jgi:hypothetical protein